MSIKKRPTNKYNDTGGEIPAVRWYNRRRLAWFSFYCLVGGTFIYWFALPLWFTLFGLNLSWLSVIGESYSWFASTLTLIIAGYMGIEYVIAARRGPTPKFAKNEDTYENDEGNVVEESHEIEEEVYDPERK